MTLPENFPKLSLTSKIFICYKPVSQLGRGVAQLVARVLWEHEVAGSSPVAPTIKKHFDIQHLLQIRNFPKFDCSLLKAASFPSRKRASLRLFSATILLDDFLFIVD